MSAIAPPGPAPAPLARPETRGERNARWIERYCRVPEGKLVGRPVKLTDKQRRWLRRIYDSPTRRFILSMARKNAKTAFTAFLLLLHLAGPEAQPNSQLLSAAQSRDQAAILFELAAKMVRMSPELFDVITIRDTVKELVCRELGTLYKALSADAKTKFGASPIFLVHDELGQVRGPRSALYEALETACAAHDHPLSVIISTQAASDADLLSVLIDDALDRQATDPDGPVKVELYTASEEYEGDDLYSEAAIREANPHFDDFMNKMEVFEQALNAQRMPSARAGYQNLILNQRIEAVNPLIDRQTWEENGAPARSLEGQKVYGGLDLSSVSDLTALVLVGEEGDIEPTFWLPEEDLAGKAKRDRVPWDLWAKQGYLKTTPGRTIRYSFVARYLREVFDRYDVVAINFDRYNMRFLKPELEQAGFTEAEIEKFKEFGQGYISMSPAIRELEARLLDRWFRHGKHPVLNMCMRNTKAETDPAGNRKPTKKKSTGRIDGAVSLIMATGALPEIAEGGDLNDFLSNPVVA